MKSIVLPIVGSLLALAACQPAATDAPATTAPAEAPAAVSAPPARPRFEGTYAATDTTCNLSITITRRDTSYFFACDSLRGPVRVWRNATDSDVGFVFVGLKSIEPEDDDISCAWQDSMLLIQNYGNAMNEYQRFDCGDKYLELRRQ
ncbi:hypothetical protein Q5H93_21145 [Hymenobacter sp. ASUV-10]|uniref:Copper resistance protein NlpE n=1 Tax=Hymenobacter aranciens TaxID=3063996 RepID=A0ABT9BG70_9BACT|nr:hypothetical protein [Hymenobacter sp. ASUV-10]MDO7877265.1 hypothetical protein [Hymenobacter sp. ASUV-10]